MRIADKMGYEQVNANLGKNRSELAELQNEASLQKRVTKPSDDPLAAARILSGRSEITGTTQFLKNINNAKTFLEYSEQSLGELNDTLVRAKELAIGQANDASANSVSREATSAEVGQLFNQAVQIGNRKLGERYLFGGFRTHKPPFDPEGGYHGDEGQMHINVGKDSKIPMNIAGSHIFLGREEKKQKDPMFARLELNGPQVEKEMKHAEQVLEHKLEKVENKAEEVLSLRGPASVGEEKPVNLSGEWNTKSVNIFKVLKDLEIGMKTNDKGAIQDSLDRIDGAIAQVIFARAQIGSRVSSMNAATDTAMKDQVAAKTMVSNLEDVDTFQLVSDINKNESTLKATLETSGKLIQPSLLDFLR